MSPSPPPVNLAPLKVFPPEASACAWMEKRWERRLCPLLIRPWMRTPLVIFLFLFLFLKIFSLSSFLFLFLHFWHPFSDPWWAAAPKAPPGYAPGICFCACYIYIILHSICLLEVRRLKREKQLCWFQYNASKEYQDFILTLMAFPYSNIYY